jgi:protein-S-isoprenylcysteine O-methyltransferase Ste14
VTAIARRVMQTLTLIIVQGVILFASAGTVRWAAGWLYVALYAGSIAASAALLIPQHRDLVEERSKGRAGGMSWDRSVTTAQAVFLLGMLGVAGLNERWGWAPALPSWLVALGVALFVLGFAVVVWAMTANPFFSQVVRIQTERGHTVVSDGPYRVLRHPGYAGLSVSAFGSALLLGSAWALLPWAVYVALTVLRTSLEDATLARELAGYREYQARTRYRLLPAMW